MLTTQEVPQLIGKDAYSPDGDKIGRIGQVFLDVQTNQPEFATVNTALLGTKESFVPLTQASWSSGGRLTVPFSKDQVKAAPSVSPTEQGLSQQDEQRLYEHYGLPYGQAHSQTGLPEETQPSGVGETSSDDAMTRSEEQLDVGTRAEQSGRARLRKYVETEHVETSVPVRREHAVVEHEPITDDNVDRATSGPDISEAEHEEVLYEEKPVVGKRTEPVERVRLRKEQDTSEEQVSEEIRKERIKAEGDVENKPR